MIRKFVSSILNNSFNQKKLKIMKQIISNSQKFLGYFILILLLILFIISKGKAQCTPDVTNPDLSCPLEIKIRTDNSSCSQITTFALPIATDQCSTPTISQIDATGLTSGSVFPFGKSSLIFQATDAANNISTCSFEVEVLPAICTYFHENILIAHDTSTTINFGVDVDLWENTAVIGAQEIRFGSQPGAAYVYNIIGRTWLPSHKLIASDGLNGDFFGNNVAVTFSNAAVSASRDNNAIGAVYMYNLPVFGGSGTISENQKLTASDGSNFDTFGSDVDLDQSILIVGAEGDDFGKGSAYVFRLQSGSWIEVAKLTASDGALGDLFGRSVAIDGNTIVVGAPEADKVYVFQRPIGGWAGNLTETAQLTPSVSSRNFGISLAIDINTIVVGDNLYFNTLHHSGAAFVYEKPITGNWTNTTENAILTPESPTLNAHFGLDVKIYKDIIAVSAPHNTNASGQVYTFKKPLDGWKNMNENDIYKDDSPSNNDSFGSAISIYENHLLSSDFATTTNGSSGAVKTLNTLASNCPDHININVLPNTCDAIVTYNPPTLLGNACGTTITQTFGNSSGSTFPVGFNLIVYSIQDYDNNMSECYFRINISDNIPPTLTCFQPISTMNSSGAILTYNQPIGNDNCPGFTINFLSGLGSGGFFPTGNHLEVFEITDYAGNNQTYGCMISVLNALPVELLDFWGEEKNHQNHLFWESNSEINLNYYEIEKRENDVFEPIGKVFARNEKSNYEFIDEENSKKKSYYRLKMVDLDGNFEFSKTISLGESNALEILNIYPNPTKNLTNILLETVKNQSIEIEIWNGIGQKIFLQKTKINQGKNLIGIDFENFNTGVYFLKITNENKSITKRIVKP